MPRRSSAMIASSSVASVRTSRVICSPSMRRPSFGIENGVRQALVEQLVAHFLFGLHVVGVRFVFDAEQRRLGDVDVPAFHELDICR